MSSVCRCDDPGPVLAANPPGLLRISVRRGDWPSIRRALLVRRAGATALADWRPGGPPDFALMIVEWWATLGEVLEFYNDEIANEAFLATATRRESTARLVALLGYRPRPALAATATLAALVSGREAITLPAGFAVESIPGPGQQPQTFELDAATVSAPGGRTPAQPPVRLATPEAGVLRVEGKLRGVAVGDRLRLRMPDGDRLLAVDALAADAAETRLSYTPDRALMASARADECRLERAGQSLLVWTFAGSALAGSDLHLAGLTRSVAAGEPVLLSAPGRTAILSGVTAVADVIWYANPPNTDPAESPGATALPVPHTRLTLAVPPTGWDAATITVGTGWVRVAALLDQEPASWTGSPTTLEAASTARFAAATAAPVLVAGAAGTGVPASLTASDAAAEATVTVDPAYLDGLALEAPLDILANLVAVTRGKTVAREVLGSGDARVPGQSFTLAKAPVTYRRAGAGFASSVTMLVDGVPWTEVESFYGQLPDAAIFTLGEREDGKSVVAFGDGENGRRLPTGKDNVVARYRYGAGAEAPPAGKLTRLPAPWPGLAQLLNPVAAGGGADPDSASAIRRYAPRSMLTLGRAVSVADFAAFAAAAAAPERTRAVWAWDEARQRTAVTIYVAGAPSVHATVRTALAAVGDPHRPVLVKAAEPVPLRLTLTLAIAPGYEAAPIVAAAHEALVGDAGLFSADRLGIGQPLFLSAVSLAVLTVVGVVTLLSVELYRVATGGETRLHGALLAPEENQWFDLSPDALSIGTEVVDG